jgi:hypothetical protein
VVELAIELVELETVDNVIDIPSSVLSDLVHQLVSEAEMGPEVQVEVAPEQLV